MRSVEDIACVFPASLKEALEIQADEKRRGRILAGGTDLMVQWESGLQPVPERVVGILGVPELRGIREEGDAIVVGAATTHWQLHTSALVRQFAPALAASAATVGGVQIQSLGTIAGNVANASPAGDLAPALLVTGGSVVVASVAGERTISLAQFFLGYRKIDLKPEELIVRFVLPKLPYGFREGFTKLGPRAAQAISKVMGAWRGKASAGVVESFAVALGSMAPTAVRLGDLETWLPGKKINKKLLDEVEAKVTASLKPIDDIRSTAEYRGWVSGRLVRGFLDELAHVCG